MLTNNGNKKKRRKKLVKWVLLVVLVAFAFWSEFDGIVDGQLYFPYFDGYMNGWPDVVIDATREPSSTHIPSTPNADVTPLPTIEPETPKKVEGGTLEFRIFDVGQADCMLIEQSGKYMMIDCATSGAADDVIERLEELNITRLEYLVLTHPHADHMGGAWKIIKYFMDRDGIGTILVSDYSASDISPTWLENLQTNMLEMHGDLEKFEELFVMWENECYWQSEKEQEQYMRDKIDQFFVNHGYWSHPVPGDIIELGDATIEFVGPNSEKYNNTNNYSLVMRVTYGEIDILLTGDAEKEVEAEMLATGFELQSEVLKVGHHGSNTSTSEEFLEAVSPEFCVISCKKGHSDRNPDQEVVDLLEAGHYVVRRTDENGEIVMTTDGENITWNCEPGDYLSGVELAEKEE